ncbi:MAG: bestrophin family ion channel [Chitinophagales bacterium]
MIAYNPKEWFTFIFRIHKADTIQRLFPMLFFIGLYAAAIVFLELNILQLSKENMAKNLTVIHSLLGLVLSLLLVFRTNTAYDRWWEGRRLWGQLVNTSRNLAIKLDAIFPADDHDNRTFYAETIGLYASVLSNHLASESTRLLLDEIEHPELENIDEQAHHIPNQVAMMMMNRTNELMNAKKIIPEHLLFINNELSSFTDVCGGCERIKNTPIPFSYNLFIKKFIFFYVMSFPYGFVFSLGYFVIPVLIFIFYVLVSLELIAEEIEDPFNRDPNDLPTNKIAENINKQVNEILLVK